MHITGVTYVVPVNLIHLTIYGISYTSFDWHWHLVNQSTRLYYTIVKSTAAISVNLVTNI